MLIEILRDIWMVNGILAGGLMVLIQLIGIAGVMIKMFEKK